MAVTDPPGLDLSGQTTLNGVSILGSNGAYLAVGSTSAFGAAGAGARTPVALSGTIPQPTSGLAS